MTQKHEPFGDLPLGEEETYDALAACYDDMTADVDYPAWADFIEALFAGSPRPVHGEPFHTVLGPGLRHRHHVFFIGRAGL